MRNSPGSLVNGTFEGLFCLGQKSSATVRYYLKTRTVLINIVGAEFDKLKINIKKCRPQSVFEPVAGEDIE